MAGVLDGMRVVEVSAFVAAPFAGLTLAQLGADVIRVDPLGGGLDYGRWPITAAGHSMYWAGLNKGKRSVTLDLRSDVGRALVRRLATAPGPDAGIVITNLAPRWLAYDTLAAVRPDVIVVALSGNPDGSPAVDYTVNASVGYPVVTGSGDLPVNHVLPAWDVAAGTMMATAVLAADRHRHRTGQGQLVELSLADVALATVGHLGHLGEVQINDADREAYGNHVFGQFGRDFVLGDGRRVMVVALTPRQWQALVDATGTGDAMQDIQRTHGVDLSAEGDRFRHREDVAAALKPWFAARSLADPRPVLETHGVLWGPYQTFRQLLGEDPRASEANPLFARVAQPGIGDYLAPGSPLRFGAVGRQAVSPAPQLGEHTEQVLGEVLAVRSVDLAAYRQAGVL